MEKIELFRNLGYNEYESKVLASFSELGEADVKKLSFNSGVPKNKIYSILKKLEKEDLLESFPNKKYRIIDLKGFIDRKIKEKENKIKELKKFKFNKSFIEEKFIFSLIKGQRAIMNKLAEANSSVKREIFGVQRGWKYWGEGIREMQKAVNRKVDVRLIGEVNDENKWRVHEWKKTGAKIRKYNKKFGKFPLRFGIFDNKYARITIGKPEIQKPEDYITIWTDSKPLVFMLRKQFLEMWKKSESF
jgi:sugar-specific transcriptional regulator TrmB